MSNQSNLNSKYYLAIDMGASSGRHILASLVNGKLELEEVYRFENGMIEKNGSLCWNHEKLFEEIMKGLKRCKELGKIPTTMAIDTWGVDHVLLDEENKVLGDTFGYRDSRTTGMDKKVYEIISEEDLYARTGIEKMLINTIYQLMAVKQNHPEYLEQAESLLMTPDYFNFLLTGVKKNEYTIASTSQLVNAKGKEWDFELIEMLGLNPKMFQPLSPPRTKVGGFIEEIQKEVGFNCTVILAGSHDTASAVLAIPTNEENVLYISSGTWSLMGIERDEPDCSQASRVANFTNEGGVDYRFRYMKNIMGLWMVQSVKKEFDEELSYGQICQMAAGESIASLVDCNDASFMAPKSMIKAVQEYCKKTNQQIPESVGEIAAVIYNSLAKCYQDTTKEIEKITGKTYDTIHVIGGGSNAEYLNGLTAKYTGKKVCAGPSEATAIGSVLVQMLADGTFSSINEARECVARSFEMKWSQ